MSTNDTNHAHAAARARAARLTPFDAESHPRLYATALRRELEVRRVGPGEYEVGSATRPGKWHRVTVTPEGYDCRCEAAGPCTHGTVAGDREFPFLGSVWWQARSVEHAEWTGELKAAGAKYVASGDLKSFNAEVRAINRGHECRAAQVDMDARVMVKPSSGERETYRGCAL